MKIKTEQIVNFIDSRIVSAKKFPTSMAYKLHVNRKACAAVYEAYTEQIKGLVDKYAEKDKDGNLVKDGNGYIIATEHIPACNKEVAEMLAEEVEVAISTIPAEMLDKCDEFDSLSVFELALIDFMIE